MSGAPQTCPSNLGYYTWSRYRTPTIVLRTFAQQSQSKAVILQNKNQVNISTKQNYANIVRGFTQSPPNSKNLKQVGFQKIGVSSIASNLISSNVDQNSPLTSICVSPKKSKPAVLPVSSGNLPLTNPNTNLPAPLPPPPSGPTPPYKILPKLAEKAKELVVYDLILASGGSLLCNVTEDLCSGRLNWKNDQKVVCNPTSSSDVPGPIIQLCAGSMVGNIIAPQTRRTYLVGGTYSKPNK